MKRWMLPTVLTAVAAFGLGLSVEPDVSKWSEETSLIATAEARFVHRPVVGVGTVYGTTRRVARRTTRRVVRRSAIYASTLPGGCNSVVINGANYFHCGATYYEPYQGQYVVVHVN